MKTLEEMSAEDWIIARLLMFITSQLQVHGRFDLHPDLSQAMLWAAHHLPIWDGVPNFPAALRAEREAAKS